MYLEEGLNRSKRQHSESGPCGAHRFLERELSFLSCPSVLQLPATMYDDMT